MKADIFQLAISIDEYNGIMEKMVEHMRLERFAYE